MNKQYGLVLLLGCTLMGTVQADDAITQPADSSPVYRWTDGAGHTHFSDTPQPGAEAVTPPTTPSPDTAFVDRQEAIVQQNNDADRKKKLTQQEQEELTQAQQYQAELKKVCAQYQENIKMLTEQAGRRIYTVDAKGVYHFFSDDERKAQLAQTQGDYDKFCSNSH